MTALGCSEDRKCGIAVPCICSGESLGLHCFISLSWQSPFMNFSLYSSSLSNATKGCYEHSVSQSLCLKSSAHLVYYLLSMLSGKQAGQMFPHCVLWVTISSGSAYRCPALRPAPRVLCSMVQVCWMAIISTLDLLFLETITYVVKCTWPPAPRQAHRDFQVLTMDSCHF